MARLAKGASALLTIFGEAAARVVLNPVGERIQSANDYGRVTLTLKNRYELPFTPEVSRTVTLSLGEPVRETSSARAVTTMFEPA